MCRVVVLLDALSLALRGSLRNSLGEEGHELANGTFLVEREGRQIAGIAQDNRSARRWSKYHGNREDLHCNCVLSRLLKEREGRELMLPSDPCDSILVKRHTLASFSRSSQSDLCLSLVQKYTIYLGNLHRLITHQSSLKYGL